MGQLPKATVNQASAHHAAEVFLSYAWSGPGNILASGTDHIARVENHEKSYAPCANFRDLPTYIRTSYSIFNLPVTLG